MRKAIPVTIVSGFLGSGKTTLLCDLLRRRQDRRLAVLINELGEISIDGALARASTADASGVEIVDFPSGLIAYSDDAQFMPTLAAIAGRPGQVDHVLIETSGVALPTAAMARLQEAELVERFVLDATLVVVDTPRLLAGEFDDPRAAMPGSVRQLFDLQLGAADVVVLNKIDELDADALLEAERRVRKRAPSVRFLELAHNARLDIRVALGLRLHQAASAAAGGRHFHGPFAQMPEADGETLTDHSRIDWHSHSGLMAHSHGLATHTHFHEQDPGWLSFTLRSGERQSVGALRAALERVAETEPLLRCKGFALGSESDTPVLFQGVQARVVAKQEKVQAPIERSELVFIGYHLNRARVASMLSRLTGTAWS
ncbi:MAG TPA: GTP-binding protein [Steroidobacteraceae bacterium]